MYWDSDAWGPGGNGFVRFTEVYGVVGMTSSDYGEDHIELFDAETFSPWGPDSYEADTIEVTSDVYSGEELLERFGLEDR